MHSYYHLVLSVLSYCSVGYLFDSIDQSHYSSYYHLVLSVLSYCSVGYLFDSIDQSHYS
jgi:hypothetical protein